MPKFSDTSTRVSMHESKKRTLRKACLHPNFRITEYATSEKGRAENRKIWATKRPSGNPKRTGKNAHDIVYRLTPSLYLPNNWYAEQDLSVRFISARQPVKTCQPLGNIFLGNSIELPEKYMQTPALRRQAKRERNRHFYGTVSDLETLYEMLSAAMRNGQKRKSGLLLLRIAEVESFGSLRWRRKNS